MKTFYELETVHGLKSFAEIELSKKYPKINIESNTNLKAGQVLKIAVEEPYIK